MKYEIKYSKKPLDYRVAIDYLDKRMQHVDIGSKKELIWFLEHNAILQVEQVMLQKTLKINQ